MHTQYRGVDSTRRGKAPPLAILSPISHRGEIGPSGASPAGALVYTWDIGETKASLPAGQTRHKKEEATEVASSSYIAGFPCCY